MEKDDALLIKRFEELSHRAYSRGYTVCSDFLSVYQQSLLYRAKTENNFILDGGYGLAERKIAVFGGEPADIACVRIIPLSQKFADALTHRDFLGSLIGLGFKREVLGDIIVRDNMAWLLCKSAVEGYIIDQLTKVKHTAVRCETSALPELSPRSLESRQVVVASERVDALISGVFRLSRSEGQTLVEQEKVFADGRMIRTPSDKVAEGAIISVRGWGRFIYDGIVNETRKGRIRADVRIF